MTAHRIWTKEEDATLADLLHMGVDIANIGESLGATYWQVRTRAQALGLKKTPRAKAPAAPRLLATKRGQWTPEEDAILERYGRGLAPLELVVQAKLPGRSRNAAAYRVEVLELEPRKPLIPTPKNLEMARATVRTGVRDILELAYLTGLHTRDLKGLLT